LRTFASLARRATVAIGIAGTLTAAVAATPAIAATPAVAATTAPQSPGTQSRAASPRNDALYSVAAASSSNVWAVGAYYAGAAGRTLIEHWNGQSWKVVASQSPGGTHGSFLEGAAVISRSRAWAVGSYNTGTTTKTLIERWNGTAWKLVPSPNPGGAHGSLLNQVAVVSPSNAWAVGGYNFVNGDERTLILHWNGRSWKRVPSPSPGGTGQGNELAGVAVVSPSSAWAVGYFQTNGSVASRTLIEHWNGRSWKRVPSPSPGAGTVNGLDAVSAVSSSSAWAVGGYTVGGNIEQTLIEHWNGRSWQKAASPNPGGSAHYASLGGVAAISSSNVWAAGFFYSGTEASATLAAHWNGRSWKQVPSPSPGGTANNSFLYAMDALSARSVWAVGSFHSGPAALTLIEHWNGKTWRQVASPNR
jgi:hypothetical protein